MNKLIKYSPLISTILAIVVLLSFLRMIEGNFINITQIGLLISTPVIVYIFSKFLVYFFQSKEETKTSILLTSLTVIFISVSPVITVVLPLFSITEYSKTGFLFGAKISDLAIVDIANIALDLQGDLKEEKLSDSYVKYRKDMFLNYYLKEKNPKEVRKYLTKYENLALRTLLLHTEKGFFLALVEKAGITEEELKEIFKLNEGGK